MDVRKGRMTLDINDTGKGGQAIHAVSDNLGEHHICLEARPCILFRVKFEVSKVGRVPQTTEVCGWQSGIC